MMNGISIYLRYPLKAVLTIVWSCAMEGNPLSHHKKLLTSWSTGRIFSTKSSPVFVRLYIGFNGVPKLPVYANLCNLHLLRSIHIVIIPLPCVRCIKLIAFAISRLDRYSCRPLRNRTHALDVLLMASFLRPGRLHCGTYKA